MASSRSSSRMKLRTFASPLFLLFVFFGPSHEASATTKPNIILFLVDDLGWADIGANNPKTFYETPNVDRLAASGMRFTQGYAACPVCSPTRGSIMTGKVPPRFGVTDFIPGMRNGKLLSAPNATQLPLAEVTLAETLREAGYTTAHFGKWHLGGEGFYPEDQGFDRNFGGLDKGGPYGGGKYFSPYGNPKLSDGPPGEHLPDRLASECIKFMNEAGDKPFFANFWFYDVHTPLMARADLKAKYEKKAQSAPADTWGQEREREVRQVQRHAVYAGMVEAMDQAVGRVLTALEKSGKADNTIVIFTTDNGGLSTSEGSPTSNLPFRAGKGWLYEGGIRVPFIFRAPGITKAGVTSDIPIMSTDIYPTLLDLAGLPQKPDQHRDGVSLKPALTGGALAARTLQWHYPHYGNQGGAPSGCIRDGDWKLIEWYEDDRAELFNIREDMGEKTDLASGMPDRVKELTAKLHTWRESVGGLMPKPNPNWSPNQPEPKKGAKKKKAPNEN
ncbi:sulfatase [Verrucomicrobiaceae bacterium SCGC AG-212-N21]|nr:sulfatase [Verrucomicrobiaceae bacterium SCGC AG-212-N21]